MIPEAVKLPLNIILCVCVHQDTTYEKSGSACDSWVVLLRGVQAVLIILSRRLCFSSVFHLHSLWLA
jgi:hypothetical protein